LNGSQHKIQQLESDLARAEALLESMSAALDGEEPSDFMLSFECVRVAWDTWSELNRLYYEQGQRLAREGKAK
jgi:hypothetical protein